MNLKPLGDRVVIEVVEEEAVTASGIVLPDTAKEKSQRGRVLAVGEGRWEDGQRVPVSVSEGDEVIIFNEEQRINDLAAQIGTIPYEILTNVSQRVKRVYFYE